MGWELFSQEEIFCIVIFSSRSFLRFDGICESKVEELSHQVAL